MERAICNVKRDGSVLDRDHRGHLIECNQPQSRHLRVENHSKVLVTFLSPVKDYTTDAGMLRIECVVPQICDCCDEISVAGVRCS